MICKWNTLILNVWFALNSWRTSCLGKQVPGLYDFALCYTLTALHTIGWSSHSPLPILPKSYVMCVFKVICIRIKRLFELANILLTNRWALYKEKGSEAIYTSASMSIRCVLPEIIYTFTAEHKHLFTISKAWELICAKSCLRIKCSTTADHF